MHFCFLRNLGSQISVFSLNAVAPGPVISEGEFKHFFHQIMQSNERATDDPSPLSFSAARLMISDSGAG